MVDHILENNPAYLLSLLGKTVKMVTIVDKIHIGKLFVIDPVYKTVVTMNPNNKDEMLITFYHAIKSLVVLPNEVDESYLGNDEHGTSEENTENSNNKTKLMKWLQQMCINVVESGDFLKIDDHVVIVPPYGPDNCICNNTIVLEKIRNVINLMPPDFM